MSFWQLIAAALCVLINVLDGFDILLMSVAAPAIGADLHLTTAEVGFVFSSGLAGMMVGALSLATAADRLGRRTIILLCLAINGAGMFLTGCSDGLAGLLLFRFITGLGVGGIMPTVNTAIAEIVNERGRSAAVVIQAAAYPLGGLIAALVWDPLIQGHTWHQVLRLACLPSIACFVLALLFLPETVPYLSRRQPVNALGRINATRRRFGQPAIAELPAKTDVAPAFVRPLFDRPLRRGFFAFSATAFLTQFSFYFFLSWLPVVMVSAMTLHGGPRLGTVLLNLGGVIGDFVFAALSLRRSVLRLTPNTMFIAFCFFAVLPMLSHTPILAGFAAFIAGASLYASMAGLYGIAPNVFPTLNRSSGTGLALSVGRLGGALSPSIGAALLGVPLVGAGPTLVIMAIPLFLSALVLRFFLPQVVPQAGTVIPHKFVEVE
ncbi:MAG: MFS transporter [Gammaproteobacteria bacterium]